MKVLLPGDYCVEEWVWDPFYSGVDEDCSDLVVVTLSEELGGRCHCSVSVRV